MYTRANFRTGKALREAVQAGERVTVFSPGPFPAPTEGKVCVEGPHYPEPHKWYAQVVVKDGVVVNVLR